MSTLAKHDLHLITDPPRPLHPVEVAIVARVTGHGHHVRVCGCGLLIVAETDLEVRCRHTEHVRAAAYAGGRG